MRIAVVVTLLALSGLLFETSAQKVIGPSIKNFGKVNDNYFRGAQPNQSQIAALKAMGVKTIIDLRRDSIPQEPAWAKERGLRYFNLRLKSHQHASEEQSKTFLRLVNDPTNFPVFVHCRGGKHRTGAMTAIYRITHDGWTAQQAFDEMQKYHFDAGIEIGPPDQKRFVFEFYEKWKK